MRKIDPRSFRCATRAISRDMNRGITLKGQARQGEALRLFKPIFCRAPCRPRSTKGRGSFSVPSFVSREIEQALRLTSLAATGASFVAVVRCFQSRTFHWRLPIC